MARILYGVTGQGFGHAMRSKVVIDHMLRQGHKVEVLAYGQAFGYLNDFYSVHKIVGLHLVYKNNKVDYLSTIMKDTAKFPEAVRNYRAMSRLVAKFQPQIVFSDYEPMSSMLAHTNRLPLVSVGNHHFISNTKIKYPKRLMKDFLAVRVVTEAMTPGADAYLVITIAKEEVKDKKTFLFPPIVGEDVQALQPVENDFVVVYLTSKYVGVLKTLRAVKNQEFRVYGFDQDKVEGNVIFRKFSRAGFLNDLRSCKAVIANAGFTVISEALQLGKPYLAIPVARQFEQLINAIYVERLGYGEYSQTLTAKQVKDFLKNLNSYKQNLSRYEKSDNKRLFAKIDSLIESLVEEE